MCAIPGTRSVLKSVMTDKLVATQAFMTEVKEKVVYVSLQKIGTLFQGGTSQFGSLRGWLLENQEEPNSEQQNRGKRGTNGHPRSPCTAAQSRLRLKKACRQSKMNGCPHSSEQAYFHLGLNQTRRSMKCRQIGMLQQN